MSVNKVILVGHLGSDPESRATPSGLEVCNLSLATNHTTFDRNTSEKNTTTEWHRVKFFGRQAEVCQQYLRKGSQIYIEGRIQTRKYTDKEGIERYSNEIIGERMQMLGGRDDSQSSGGQQGFQSQGKAPGSDYQAAKDGRRKPADFDELESDLPFQGADMIRRIEHARYFLSMYKLYRQTYCYPVVKAWKRAKELLAIYASYR